MDQNLDTKVQIKQDLMKGLIFGIEGRLSIALMISFAGY